MQKVTQQQADEIVKVWRKDPSEIRYELRSTDLRELNLSGTDLRGALLTDSDLSSTNLQDADLRNADLIGCTMFATQLTRANLAKAHLGQANLRRAQLYKTDLSYANMFYTDLTDANLSTANVTGIQLHFARLQGTIWPIGKQVYSMYGIGTLRVLHYQPATDTVWAGCWDGSLEQLEGKIPQVARTQQARTEYGAALAYLRQIEAMYRG
jgi:uncharacterized protein YjbI with pentapeptide repeats